MARIINWQVCPDFDSDHFLIKIDISLGSSGNASPTHDTNDLKLSYNYRADWVLYYELTENALEENVKDVTWICITWTFYNL